MPWSNQSGGGGWKGGNGGPWGQGPRNTAVGPHPPDLEELLRRSQDRLRRVLPGRRRYGRNLNPLTLIIILVLGVALIGYNFFTFRVQPDELGVVLRFGKFNRQAQPGLNFRLPYPIETVYTPKVTRVNRVTIGQVQDDRSGASSGRDIPEESLMLTGDENIVDIDFSVFWVINDASNYLFNMEDPEGTVKAAAESAMREVVGRSNIQPLLTQARQITETDVQELIQATLDEFGAGIQITQVQLLKVDPPADVIASFRDVQAARADQERVQNEAQTYANKVIPEARGQALADHRGGERLSRPDHRRGARPGRPLRSRSRELPGGAGRDPPAHVSRDDGARLRRHGQGHHRREGQRARASFPTCRSTSCLNRNPAPATGARQ